MNMRDPQDHPVPPRFPLPHEPEMGLHALLCAAALPGQGHEQAQLRVYLAPGIQTLLLRFFPDDPATVDHLTDETLDRVIKNAGKCIAESTVGIRLWIMRIAQNVAIDELRRINGDNREAKNTNATTTQPHNRLVSLSALELFSASRSRPDLKEEPSDDEKLVQKLLENIMVQFDQQLTMLSLRQEGESWKQIGELFDISAGAAKERVRQLHSSIPRVMASEIYRMSPQERTSVLAYLAKRGIKL